MCKSSIINQSQSHSVPCTTLAQHRCWLSSQDIASRRHWLSSETWQLHRHIHSDSLIFLQLFYVPCSHAEHHQLMKTHYQIQKALGETQTLCTGCSRWRQKFSPVADPFPGVHDRQNLISWSRSLPAYTDPVWWRSMHAISSYHGNRHRWPACCRQDRLQYTVPQPASAQCNNLTHIDW